MASGWAKDKRPARQRYWERRRLELRKVRNILRNRQRVTKKGDIIGDLMTQKQATGWWQRSRKGRVPDKFLPLKKSM